MVANQVSFLKTMVSTSVEELLWLPGTETAVCRIADGPGLFNTLSANVLNCIDVRIVYHFESRKLGGLYLVAHNHQV